MLSLEFGECHTPNFGAAFQVRPRKQIGFFELKLAAQGDGVVVIDQFQGAIDLELIKRGEDEGPAILRRHGAGVELDDVYRVCHGCFCI